MILLLLGGRLLGHRAVLKSRAQRRRLARDSSADCPLVGGRVVRRDRGLRRVHGKRAAWMPACAAEDIIVSQPQACVWRSLKLAVRRGRLGRKGVYSRNSLSS